MKETLAARVGRIISGGAHMLVEAVENMAPESVMEQAIREIDGAIDEVRAELGRTVANKHLATKRLMEENQKHEDLGSKIELAVEEGREDLAEAAISRQLDIEAQIPVLESTVRDCMEESKELEGYIVALKAKRREMESELAHFRRARAEAEPGKAPGVDVAPGGSRRRVESSVERAESAFERVLTRQTGVPSGVGRAGNEDETRLVELEEMARKNRIQERLAAAKAKVTGEQ